MKNIKKIFDEQFSPWSIALPDAAVESGQAGKISTGGWSIQYQFGSDAKGSFLDYYAVHRMTNDQHMRIYEAGEVEMLPAPLDFRLVNPNATEAERQKTQQEYYEQNRRIGEELRRKGFR